MAGTMIALKLLDGKRRTRYGISTLREVTVSALGELDFGVHTGFLSFGAVR